MVNFVIHFVLRVRGVFFFLYLFDWIIFSFLSRIHTHTQIIICRYVLISSRSASNQHENKLMVCKREHATHIRPQSPNKRNCADHRHGRRGREKERKHNVEPYQNQSVCMHPNWFAHSLFLSDSLALFLFFNVFIKENSVLKCDRSRSFWFNLHIHIIKMNIHNDCNHCLWHEKRQNALAYHIKAITNGMKTRARTHTHAHPPEHTHN